MERSKQDILQLKNKLFSTLCWTNCIADTNNYVNNPKHRVAVNGNCAIQIGLYCKLTILYFYFVGIVSKKFP